MIAAQTKAASASAELTNRAPSADPGSHLAKLLLDPMLATTNWRGENEMAWREWIGVERMDWLTTKRLPQLVIQLIAT
ncbi:MAG: hypothetical protein CMP96_08135 [Gammaproteobacteria bacterium]|nr:hypothetical protein [Gammaproteobacteria bacterium]